MFKPINLFQDAKEKNSGCLFCKPFEKMVLFTTDFFQVLIDTFPVALGHLMISTKDHYGCAGEIPASRLAEFIELKNQVRNFALQFSPNVCFYEHGRAGGCTTVQPGLKCEHFHLHCVPIQMDITPTLDAMYSKISFDDEYEIPEFFFTHGDYLFFEGNDEKKHFYIVEDKPVAPHLLRTLICNGLNHADFANWEQINDPTLSITSYEEIRKKFSQIALQEAL